MTHSLLHILEVQSYGQSGGSEMEALQEAYRQISNSAGECEDGPAEGSRTPLSLTTLQPVSTVESGQTQHLANFCQSLWACLCFRPFDLQLPPHKCFQFCFKPNTWGFYQPLCLRRRFRWSPASRLDFGWVCHTSCFSWNLTVFCWKSVTLTE